MADKSWLEEKYETVTGPVRAAFGDVTNKIADGLDDLTKDKSYHIDSVTTSKAMPWIAGGVGALAGWMLLEPANKLFGWLFKGVKKVVTGFGFFEKIPLIGGLFTMLGNGVETVGKYVGYAAPAIAGFIGYEMFRGSSRRPITGMSGMGTLGNPVVEGKHGVQPPGQPLQDFTIPEPAALPKADPVDTTVAEEKTGKKAPDINTNDTRDAREKVQAAMAANPSLKDALKEADEALARYQRTLAQEYENNRVYAARTIEEYRLEQQKSILSARINAISKLQATGLSEKDADLIVTKIEKLPSKIYGDQDFEEWQSQGKTLTTTVPGPFTNNAMRIDIGLEKFGRAFQRCYGVGLVPVNAPVLDKKGDPVLDNKGRQTYEPAVLEFYEMSVTQKEEFLAEALKIASQRKEAILRDIEKSANETKVRQLGTDLDENSRGAFNYSDYDRCIKECGIGEAFAKCYAMRDFDTATINPDIKEKFKCRHGKRDPGIVRRDVEHAFILQFDGCDPALPGFSSLGTSMFNAFGGLDVSLGYLDGHKVKDRHKTTKTDFDFANNKNTQPDNLSATFKKWQEARGKHEALLKKGAEAHRSEVKVMDEKLAFATKTGLMVIEHRQAYQNGNPIPNEKVIHVKNLNYYNGKDMKSVPEYKIYYRTDSKTISEIQVLDGERNHKKMITLDTPITIDPDKFEVALQQAVTEAQKIETKEQYAQVKKEGSITIMGTGRAPCSQVNEKHEDEKIDTDFMVIRRKGTNGKTDADMPEYKIFYKPSGEIVKIFVKEPGASEFKVTSAATLLHIDVILADGEKKSEADLKAESLDLVVTRAYVALGHDPSKLDLVRDLPKSLQRTLTAIEAIEAKPKKPNKKVAAPGTDPAQVATGPVAKPTVAAEQFNREQRKERREQLTAAVVKPVTAPPAPEPLVSPITPVAQNQLNNGRQPPGSGATV